MESNARILESHKELAVQDAHTAVYRVKYSKQILSYNGKVREAEIKVPFNPAMRGRPAVQRRRDFQNRPAPGNFHQ